MAATHGRLLPGNLVCDSDTRPGALDFFDRRCLCGIRCDADGDYHGQEGHPEQPSGALSDVDVIAAWKGL